jgi:hypothetical protein
MLNIVAFLLPFIFVMYSTSCTSLNLISVLCIRSNFFFIKVITDIFNKRYFASLTCVFYLRHSSNWNPHRLHSEPFPPKENHNVGLLRFDDDHDHICYRFAQVQIFGGKSNVFKSLQYYHFAAHEINDACKYLH